MNKKDIFGGLVATAVAGMIFSAPTFAADKKEAKPAKKGMFCENNSCKGHSDCGGHGNENGCKGKNECKGHGFVEAKNKAECGKKGGNWKEDAAKEEKKEEKKEG